MPTDPTPRTDTPFLLHHRPPRRAFFASGANCTGRRHMLASGTGRALSPSAKNAGGEGLEPPLPGPKPGVLPTRRPPNARHDTGAAAGRGGWRSRSRTTHELG